MLGEVGKPRPWNAKLSWDERNTQDSQDWRKILRRFIGFKGARKPAYLSRHNITRYIEQESRGREVWLGMYLSGHVQLDESSPWPTVSHRVSLSAALFEWLRRPKVRLSEKIARLSAKFYSPFKISDGTVLLSVFYHKNIHCAASNVGKEPGHRLRALPLGKNTCRVTCESMEKDKTAVSIGRTQSLDPCPSIWPTRSHRHSSGE